MRLNLNAKAPRPAPAFTLIELLVVIAIIALLVGILLPSLGKARLEARATQCLTQCRQVVLGMSLYQNDYDAYPAHQVRNPDGSRYRWFQALADYADTQAAHACPSTPAWEVGRNNSYGYNYKYLGSLRDNVDAGNPFRPFETFPVRGVRAPSKTIAFADCDGTGRTRPWAPDGPDNAPDRWGNHGYTLDPTFIPLRSLTTRSGGAVEPYSTANFRSFLSERHNGRSVLAMVDGSARGEHPREVYRDNSLWNGLGHDPQTAVGEHAPEARLDRHVTFKFDPSSGQIWPYD